jgi:hypothetical protein
MASTLRLITLSDLFPSPLPALLLSPSTAFDACVKLSVLGDDAALVAYAITRSALFIAESDEEVLNPWNCDDGYVVLLFVCSTCLRRDRVDYQSSRCVVLCVFSVCPSQNSDLIAAMLWFDVTPNLALLIVGFQSGVLRCFDKAGNVLLSQHLHRGGIGSLKTNPSVGLQRAFAADLFVAYADCVLHIEGNSIFDSLTKPRQSSSSHRGGGIVRDDYDASLAASTTAWRFHKYQLQGQGAVLDVVPIPHPSAPLAVAPLSSACFLAVGSAPMIAVYPVAAGADSTFAFTSGAECCGDAVIDYTPPMQFTNAIQTPCRRTCWLFCAEKT